MRKKIWKKIPGYSNFEASNDGEIRDRKNKSLIKFKKSYSGFGKCCNTYGNGCLTE